MPSSTTRSLLILWPRLLPRGPRPAGVHFSTSHTFIPPIALIAAWINPSGRSTTQISMEIRPSTFAQNQLKIRFHSSIDACPRGICSLDLASLFLANLGKISAQISVVQSFRTQFDDPSSSYLFGSPRWHNRIPPGSMTVRRAYQMLPPGGGRFHQGIPPLLHEFQRTTSWPLSTTQSSLGL